MSGMDEIKNIYNNIAEEYDKKRANPDSATWNDILESPAIDSVLKPLVKLKKILDLGCGTGILTKKIVAWGGNATGIDISEKMIQIAKTNNRGIEFFVGNSNDLLFDKNHFDIVTSSLVMHYMEDLHPCFAEAARVLKDNGHFVFTMHHPVQESFKVNQSKENGRPVLQPYFHNNSYYWRMCNAEILSYHHTFEDIIKNLKSAGFVLKDLIECRPDPSTAGTFADYEFTSQYPTFCLFHACLT